MGQFIRITTAGSLPAHILLQRMLETRSNSYIVASSRHVQEIARHELANVVLKIV